MDVPGGQLEGRAITEVWSPEIGAQILQAIHRTLKDRRPTTVRFSWHECHYEARVHAHARDRALCIIREVPGSSTEDPTEGVRGTGKSANAWREFFDTIKLKVADAKLRQLPLALGLIHLDGLKAVERILDFALVDELRRQLLARLPDGGDHWSVSVVGEDLLGLIVERHSDREAVRDIASTVLQSLAKPVALNSSTFEFSPRGGIALLGEDATRTRPLIEHAHSAMLEARRSAPNSVVFYSDTLRLRSLARLDLKQELRDAIAEDQLSLRYVGRHDLHTGALYCVQAYLTWPHPMRGELRAADFLPVAETTGLSVLLSRWALQRLRRDLPSLRTLCGPEVKISFGALRHHFADGQLMADVREWLATNELQPRGLELRIAERTLSTLPAAGTMLRGFTDLGVSVVIDEFGRGATSLPKLARLPVQAVQLDRALVVSAASDPIARKAVRAAVAMAVALELRPSAAGIDSPEIRDRLMTFGCIAGSGDCFPALELPGLARPDSVPGHPRREARKARI